MKLKIFASSLFLSLPIWLSINAYSAILEKTYFDIFVPEKGTASLAAVLPQKIQKISESLPEISASSAIIAWISSDSRTQVLFEKNSNETLPIASLTKIAAAEVALESYSQSDEFLISSSAEKADSDTGNFKTGQSFKMRGLLDSALVESSNDAVYALAEKIGAPNFLEKMNAKALRIGLKNTRFEDPAGLDPDLSQKKPNISTSKDLLVLAKYILENNPGIFEISRQKTVNIFENQGDFHHLAISTNALFSDADFALKNSIIGVKTGWTPLAGGCLLMVTEFKGGYLASIVLGSPDRFEEMKKLVNWAAESFKWE